MDRAPEDLALAPAESLREAQRLVEAGLPFQAHEVLEGTWKATEGAQRPLWQGLAQLAVGLTYLQRGNATGAQSLLRRGAERIEPFAADPPHGIDVAGLARQAVELADQVEHTRPPARARLTFLRDGDRPAGPR